MIVLPNQVESVTQSIYFLAMQCRSIENPEVPWGGKRPGAGRKAPAEGKLELLSIRVSPAALAKLKGEAKRRGVTLRELIEELARKLPEAK